MDKNGQIRYSILRRCIALKRMKKTIWIAILLTLTLAFSASSAQAASIGDLLGWFFGSEEGSTGDEGYASDDREDSYYMNLEVSEDEEYDTKDEVCAYLVQFHELPSNYMTKKEARKRGWEGGALNRVVNGKCIGGDVFGNYEGVLPEERGRVYHECDIDTINASSRGAKRIVWSGDDDAGEWNVYYTDDHYETFTLLWGDDES